MCSTPFGINGRNASQFPAEPSTAAVCSTPFGINGRNAPNRRTDDGASSRCAQRLSASTEGTRLDTSAGRIPAAMCSTPFGINGRNAWLRRIRMPRVARDVLNAFRHQRKERPRIRPERASAAACAQRLSASTEGTRPDRDVDPRSDRTCSTPFGINGRNAGHCSTIVWRVFACSTPFGINGRNAPVGICKTFAAVSGAQRLSASTEGTPRVPVLAVD